MTVKKKPEVMLDLQYLFQRCGHKYYGEECTQLEHAISTAEQAILGNAKECLVISAFLHDIGHFIADVECVKGFSDIGHPQHDEIAANWLKNYGFPDSVTQPIKHHVCAKRYLQRPTKSSSLKNSHTLSKASIATLAQQGGAMTDDEVVDFENSSSFHDALLLRSYDDMGKPSHQIHVNLTYWLDRVENFYLSARG